jgi:3-phenylpropionate/trans-cinnamate dioxygenase ferredoxin subunit
VPRPEATARRQRARTRVGRLADIPDDRFHVVRAGREEVGLIRTPNGVFALRNYCPHMGGRLCAGDVRGTMRATGPDELVYDEDHRIVRCPWHRWEWSVEDGTPVGRVTNLRVKLFPVELDGDDVYVVA